MSILNESHYTSLYHVVCWLQDARVALEGVNSIAGMTEKQMDYVMKILDVQPHDHLSFRMFGVAAALSDRVTKME